MRRRHRYLNDYEMGRRLMNGQRGGVACKSRPAQLRIIFLAYKVLSKAHTLRFGGNFTLKVAFYAHEAQVWSR